MKIPAILPVLSFGFAVLVQGDDWPARFSVATEGPVYASAAADHHGNVFFGGHDGSFRAYNRNGALLWRFDGISDWIEATALITAEDAVVFGSWNGNVYALDRSTGSLRWQYTTGAYLIASPALLPDGRIVIGGGDGILYCLTPQGALSWLYVNDTEIESSPAVDANGNIYYGTLEGKLISLTADGAFRWSRDATAVSGVMRSFQSSPALSADGTLYIGSSNGRLYAVNSTNGALLWHFAAEDAVDSSPALGADGTVYFASRDGYLYALDPAGFQIWEQWVGDVFYSSPAVDANGNIHIVGYVGNGLSVLWQIAPSAQVLRSVTFASINDSSVLLTAQGDLFVGMYDHRMYAFNATAPVASDWPQFRNAPSRTGLFGQPALRGWPQPDSAFTDWQELGSGWAFTPGWSSGWVFIDTFPWCWHLEHGWTYVLGVVPGEAWIFEYDGSLGWVYWTEQAADHYYGSSLRAWLRHERGTTLRDGNRRFFNYSTGSWVAID